MGNITFNKATILEIESLKTNLLEIYYKKFLSIYGKELVDIKASKFSDEELIYKTELNESFCFKKAIDFIFDLENNKYSLLKVALNDKIIGYARLICENGYYLVPEIVFIDAIKPNEVNCLTILFINYLEQQINGKLLIEVPYKEEDLLFAFYKAGYNLEINNKEKYNTDKTFLLSKKILSRLQE